MIKRLALLLIVGVAAVACNAAASVPGDHLLGPGFVGRGTMDADLIPTRVAFCLHDEVAARADILQGRSFTLEDWLASDAAVPNPINDNALYANHFTQPTGDVSAGEFALTITRYGPAAAMVVLPQEAHWGSLRAGDGFAVVPVSAGTRAGAGEDPRATFIEEPTDAVRLSADLSNLHLVGPSSVLLRDVSFTIRTTDGQTFDRDLSQQQIASIKGHGGSTETFATLQVEGAALDSGPAPACAEVSATSVHASLQGSVFPTRLLPGSTSTLLDPNDAPVATGDLEFQLERADADQVDLHLLSLHPASGGSQAGQATLAVPSSSARTFYLLFGAFGAITAGAAAFGIHGHRQARRHDRASPIQLPASDPRPALESKPRTTGQLEAAFRNDPSSAPLALELGLAYASAGRGADALPLLQLAIRAYPKIDAARYFAGLALLDLGRLDDALQQLHYAFRLNPLNVARFIQEGAAHRHGHDPRVRAMLSRWSRQFHESNARGYA